MLQVRRRFSVTHTSRFVIEIRMAVEKLSDKNGSVVAGVSAEESWRILARLVIADGCYALFTPFAPCDKRGNSMLSIPETNKKFCWICGKDVRFWNTA